MNWNKHRFKFAVVEQAEICLIEYQEEKQAVAATTVEVIIMITMGMIMMMMFAMSMMIMKMMIMSMSMTLAMSMMALFLATIVFLKLVFRWNLRRSVKSKWWQYASLNQATGQAITASSTAKRFLWYAFVYLYLYLCLYL